MEETLQDAVPELDSVPELNSVEASPLEKIEVTAPMPAPQAIADDGTEMYSIATRRPVSANPKDDYSQPEAPEETSFAEAYDGARFLYSSVSAMAWENTLDKMAGEIDHSFIATEEMMEEHKVPVMYREDIRAASRNEKEFQLRATRLQEELYNQGRISNAGAKGLYATIGVSLLDEAALISSLGTSPLIAYGSRAGRLKKMLQAGTVVAAENMTLEGILADANTTQDVNDVLLVGATSFTLGSLAGLISRSGQAGELARSVENYKSAIDTDIIKKVNDKGVVDVQKSAGAQEANVPKLLEEDLPAEVANTPKAVAPLKGFLKRFDIVGTLGRSENEWARYAGRLLAEEGAGLEDGSVVRASASEMATLTRYQVETKMRKGTEPAYKEYLKEQGIPFYKGPWKRREFFTKVTEHIRTGNSTDPNVVKAANAMRQTYGDMLEKLKKSGVKGFEDIEANANYVPRLFNFEGVRRLNSKYGNQGVTNLIATALYRGSDDITQEQAKKIAKVYFDKMYSVTAGKDAGLEMRMANAFSESKGEFLKRLLVDSGMDEDEINSILYQIVKGGKKTGVNPRAKHRIKMDEGATLELKRQDGTGNDSVRIDDLFENDAEILTSTYLHQMSGHIALAEKGIKSDADFDKLLEKVARRAADTGSDGATEVKKVKTLYDSIIGVPLERDPQSALAVSGRIARDLNFTRMMGQVGFAQLAEIGNMLGLVGIKTIMKHVPEFRAIANRLKSGDIEDSLGNELEAMFGLGAERLRSQVYTKYDEMDTNVMGQGIAGKAIHGLGVARRVTSDLSGMTPITSMLHRYATRGISQNFLDYAMKNQKVTPAVLKRLRSYGLDDGQLDKVLANIAKHADTTDSKFFSGKKLARLNIEKWDSEAADAFTFATFRQARRVIQENDVGNTFMWAHSTTGKLLSQFRSFMFVAYTKQLQHNVHMGDFQTGAAFSLSMMFAGMAYIAQTRLNAEGRADKDEYLEKRLSPESIAKSAFQRSGFASLIPMAVDTGTFLAGSDPVFQYGRTSGLATGLVTGNPTADLGDKLAKSIRGLARIPRTDGEFSKSDWEATTRTAPLSNAVGIKNFLEIIGNSFPDTFDK